MISSLRIDGYRGFERFEMADLGRVNLLVGTNNSGKTSVLEALHLLSTGGEPGTLWQLLNRRGERFLVEQRGRGDVELDVSHMFTGHDIKPGTKFTISAMNDTPERSLTVAVGKWTGKSQEPEPTAVPGNRMALHLTGHPTPPLVSIPLTRNGGVTLDAIEMTRRPSTRLRTVTPAQFITTESVDADELVLLWNRVALTPDEETILRALRFLDRSIERIAAQAVAPWLGGWRSRSGFIIKVKDREQPIPIGSMGDGMWRMLAMAIAITQSRGGVLLVDEIDTGLHYTVMTDMWRLILSAADALDVQVFATTHSLDCIESLARATKLAERSDGLVTLQRIEAGRGVSVPYSEDEIAVVAERHIEVR